MFRPARHIEEKSPPLRIHEPRSAAPGQAGRGANDLVIGAMSGYAFETIQYWVNSLERSGFRGKRTVICYDGSFDTVEELNRRGFEVVTFAESTRRRRYFFPRRGFRPEDTSIDRFFQLWRYLEPRKDQFRYVVAADVRDVIFQSDPSQWLEERLGEKRLNVGSEGVLLGDEPWNRDVVQRCYGEALVEKMAGTEVYNAGTIGGHSTSIADIALNVFLISRHNPASYTDQTALNILLSLEPYRSVTRFNPADGNWACQAATTADPVYRNARGRRVLTAPPLLDGDAVYTPSGEKYCLVHQYDRIAAWNERLWHFYAD